MKTGRPKKKNYRPRNPNHSRKFHRCVSQAKAWTKVKSARYIYVSDMLDGNDFSRLFKFIDDE